MKLLEEGEASPLSLIEIENLDFNGISYSPLTLTRSDRPNPQSEAMMDMKGQTRCYSSPTDPGNKENHITKLDNNLDMPVFTEEPVQTKKRKKGRGCNLRKSLAWNRAFLTEEGVLNPLELSILSGSVIESSKSFLSRVNEGGTSPVVGSCISSNRSVLQAVEENHSKETPARFRNENQKLDGLFSKLESFTQEDSPLPASSRREQLAKGTSRTVLQFGGCPRPITSHSQKRFTNTSTTNGMSRIPKPLATKADPSLLSVLTKNVIQPTKRSKCNQNASPDILAKNTSLKGPSVSTRKGLTCTVSLAKSSVPCPKKRKANPPSETRLSVGVQTPQVDTAIGTADMKTIPEQAHMHTSTGHSNSNEVMVRLPEDVQLINRNIPSAQYHTKPSGLRMPSPSLGYFCLGKVSASHSFLSEKNTQPCNLSESNNPTTRKPSDLNHTGERKPLYASSVRSPKMCMDAPTTGASGAVTSGRQVSTALKCMIPSIVTLKSNLELNTLGKKGLEDSSDSWSQEKSNSNCSGLVDSVSKQIRKQALIMSDPGEATQISYTENHKLLMRDDFPLAEIASFKQSQEDHSFHHVSDDSSVSRGTNDIELANLHSLSQLSCGKKLTRSVSRVNNEEEHPHAETAAFKEPYVISEYQRPPNGHQPVEINNMVPDSKSGLSKNNIDPVSSVEAESPFGLREEQVAGVGTARSLESVCSSTESISSSIQTVPQSYGNIYLGGDNELASRLLSEETQTALSGNGEHPDTGLQSQSKKEVLSNKDKSAVILNKKRQVDDDSKQDHISMTSRVTAVPFSDEWVAALEAVGEDILTMKTGAVQNSPPDKSLPDLGPYSPVKRNTQEIGPFDCTKYTSLPTSDTH